MLTALQGTSFPGFRRSQRAFRDWGGMGGVGTDASSVSSLASIYSQLAQLQSLAPSPPPTSAPGCRIRARLRTGPASLRHRLRWRPGLSSYEASETLIFASMACSIFVLSLHIYIYICIEFSIYIHIYIYNYVYFAFSCASSGPDEFSDCCGGVASRFAHPCKVRGSLADVDRELCVT